MKKQFTKLFIIATLLSVGSLSVLAQKENVGIGTTQPNESAALDITSSKKGLLIPRMTLLQRNAIQKPVNGLMIYQNDLISGFYFYDGNGWKPLAEAKSVVGTDNDWTTTGNAGMNPATNFIGTTDNQPLVFKVGGTRIGYFDASAYRNIFIGLVSGNGSSPAGVPGASGSGSYNTGLGGLSLYSIQTGVGNVGLGYASAANITSGEYNIAIGASALQDNILGNTNTAIGSGALMKNMGSANMGLGGFALRNNVLGSNNIAIGNGAGYSATGSSSVFIGTNSGYNETASNKLYIANSNTDNALIKGDFEQANLKINIKGTPSTATGYLAIGDFTTAASATAGTGGLPLPANIGAAGGYRLVVQDGILCEKVKVALRATGSTDWADYVFEPEYKAKMRTLEEVEAFTLANKHLPNVPTTEQVQKEGLDMHQTSRMFMEKIEELTLYMIEMNKEIKALKAENAKLKK